MFLCRFVERQELKKKSNKNVYLFAWARASVYIVFTNEIKLSRIYLHFICVKHLFQMIQHTVRPLNGFIFFFFLFEQTN